MQVAYNPKNEKRNIRYRDSHYKTFSDDMKNVILVLLALYLICFYAIDGIPKNLNCFYRLFIQARSQRWNSVRIV